MGKLLHTSKVKIQKEPGKSKIKRAQVEDFRMFCAWNSRRNRAVLQAFTGCAHALDAGLHRGGSCGCMTGTVAGALEARGVRADPKKLQVEAEGKNRGSGRQDDSDGHQIALSLEST